MSKVTLQTLTSGYYSTTLLNDNFQEIMDAFDNTITRNGGIPNYMESDLDMNANNIYNVQDIYCQNLYVAGSPVQDISAVILAYVIRAEQAALSAEAARDTANTYASQAASSAASAADSATESACGATEAYRWANTAEDSEVLDCNGVATGEYSAFHWAEKARQYSEAVVAGQAVAYTGSSAPVSPDDGWLWYKTDEPRFLVYWDSTWVDVITSCGGGGTTAGWSVGNNLGAGEGIYSHANNDDLYFKSITGTSNITVSASATEVNIAGPDLTNYVNTVNTVGSAGLTTFTKSNNILSQRKLEAGTGIGIVQDAGGQLVVSATAGTGNWTLSGGADYVYPTLVADTAPYYRIYDTGNLNQYYVMDGSLAEITRTYATGDRTIQNALYAEVTPATPGVGISNGLPYYGPGATQYGIFTNIAGRYLHYKTTSGYGGEAGDSYNPAVRSDQIADYIYLQAGDAVTKGAGDIFARQEYILSYGTNSAYINPVASSESFLNWLTAGSDSAHFHVAGDRTNITAGEHGYFDNYVTNHYNVRAIHRHVTHWFESDNYSTSHNAYAYPVRGGHYYTTTGSNTFGAHFAVKLHGAYDVGLDLTNFRDLNDDIEAYTSATITDAHKKYAAITMSADRRVYWNAPTSMAGQPVTSQQLGYSGYKMDGSGNPVPSTKTDIGGVSTRWDSNTNTYTFSDSGANDVIRFSMGSGNGSIWIKVGGVWFKITGLTAEGAVAGGAPWADIYD